jgi:hypothetical protein
MSSATGNAGSQAGQQALGSQAGQSTSTDGQQGQQNGAGSQEGQHQTQEQIVLEGMLPGETLEQAWQRVTGALSTSRKQAASYRTRLQSQGVTDPDNEDNAGSPAGQRTQSSGNSRNDAGNDDRIARLENELRAEREARRGETTARQLLGALASEGALNPERAMRLIDTARLNVGDDGSVDDPLGAVRELKASDPYLFGDRRGSADGGAGMGSDAPIDLNTAIRRKAGFA